MSAKKITAKNAKILFFFDFGYLYPFHRYLNSRYKIQRQGFTPIGQCNCSSEIKKNMSSKT